MLTFCSLVGDLSVPWVGGERETETGRDWEKRNRELNTLFGFISPCFGAFSLPCLYPVILFPQNADAYYGPNLFFFVFHRLLWQLLSETAMEIRHIFSVSRGFCWCFELKGRPSQNALLAHFTFPYLCFRDESLTKHTCMGFPILVTQGGLQPETYIYACLYVVGDQGKPVGKRVTCTVA